jgi:hypothetical protein
MIKKNLKKRLMIGIYFNKNEKKIEFPLFALLQL